MAEEPLTPSQQSGEIPQLLPALSGEWQFINTTSPPPATGQIRLNNGQQSSATVMYVHRTSALGVDAAGMLADIKVGHVLHIQTRDDAARWNNYVVSGTPINQGGVYTEIPVTWQSGGQPLAQQRTLLSTEAVNVQVPVTSPALAASAGSVGVSTPVPIKNVTVAVQGLVLRAESGAPTIISGNYLPGYAFPGDTPAGFSHGMTMRQYYAGQAIVGFIAASNVPATNLVGRLADFCFTLADSMIAYEQREAAGYVRPIVGSDRNQRIAPVSGAAPKPSVTGARTMASAEKAPPQTKTVFPRRIIS